MRDNYPPGTDMRLTAGAVDVTCACGEVTELQWERDHAVGPYGFTWIDDPRCQSCGREFSEAELDEADEPFDPRDEPNEETPRW